MPFKFNQRNVFLTYPRCTLSKETALQGIQQIAVVQDYCISVEAHADGTPHIHAFIKFKDRVSRTSPRAFDLGCFHPNIEAPKSASDCQRVIAYVQKHGDFISNISPKISKTELLGKELLQKGLTREVVHANPSLLFKNYTQIRLWLGFARPQVARPLSVEKKRHLWIHGPSNSGKTTWLRACRNVYQCYEIPINNDWSHLEADAEVLFFDEYRGNLTVQDLNRICDGDTRLNTKGGSVTLHKVIVIILSNFDLSECYRNVPNHILDTLYNRFNVFDLSLNTPSFPRMSIRL